MAFLIQSNRISLSRYTSKPTLVFDMYLPETARELIGMRVNLYKNTKQHLKYIADELNIFGYERMSVRELAHLLKPYIHFVVPEHLQQYYTSPAVLREKYEHIPQLYIPQDWITRINNVKFIFYTNAFDTTTSNNKYTYPFNLCKVSVMRRLCEYIGIDDAIKLTKNEMLDVLEDKLVFAEQAG